MAFNFNKAPELKDIMNELPADAVEAKDNDPGPEEGMNFLLVNPNRPKLKLYGDGIVLQLEGGSVKIDTEAKMALARHHLENTPGMSLIDVSKLEASHREILESTGPDKLPQAAQGAFTSSHGHEQQATAVQAMIIQGAAVGGGKDIAEQMGNVEIIEDPTKTAVRVEEGFVEGQQNSAVANPDAAKAFAGTAPSSQEAGVPETPVSDSHEG